MMHDDNDSSSEMWPSTDGTYGLNLTQLTPKKQNKNPSKKLTAFQMGCIYFIEIWVRTLLMTNINKI